MSAELELDDIQGLLAWGYGKLAHASLHLLAIADRRAGGGWLAGVAEELTSAAGSTPTEAAVNVALTPAGLTRLGLSGDALEQFSAEFHGGMTTPHRRRILGDVDGRAPERWQWGGPGTPPIHALLLLYAATPAGLAALERRLVEGARGVTALRRLDSAALDDREHFGFRDGISQPAVEGLGGDQEQAIRAGEFVLGYRNEYGLYTDRPLLDRAEDPDGLLPTAAGDAGRVDLGRNGTYLVLRQLGQDVPGFWRFMDEASSGDEALAAKLVGRWPSGAPLVLAPEGDVPELGARRADANDFGYARLDPEGLRCPLGAHIRRANPRDSLDPNPGTPDSLAINRRHRLLRRGRSYGARLTREQALGNGHGGADDPRGLHFACLCANIARQFEFVQHTWINNPKFAGLYEDPDPLIGPEGATLTIQARPVRRRVTGLPEFVSVHGGGYFFLPGRRALRYLAGLARRR